MTHDPLCPRATYDMPCCCNLIERVRLSEQQRAIKRSMEDTGADLDGLPGHPTISCPECREELYVPVSLKITTDGDGAQFIECDPDLTDVWAHAWTHAEQS